MTVPLTWEPTTTLTSGSIVPVAETVETMELVRTGAVWKLGAGGALHQVCQAYQPPAARARRITRTKPFFILD